MVHGPPLVIALGGHALQRPGEEGTIPKQFEHTRETAAAVVPVLDPTRGAIITHGNGPQVGSILRRVELAAREVYSIPLEVCVADTQGGMGYMIAQCLNNELQRRGIRRTFSTLVTTVEVDPRDPAFDRPDKPIGPFYPAERADRLRGQRGWRLREFPGQGFRRVVASPRPRSIVELGLIRMLAAEGEWLIAGGGGGIPVVRSPDGSLCGVEAVVDKDFTTLLLAAAVQAATVLIVTSVPHVALNFGRPTQTPLAVMTVADARRHLADGQFPAGSMGPKIEAAAAFVEQSGHANARVVICDAAGIAAALAGDAGTAIVK